MAQSASTRPTAWWLATLEKRAARMKEERLDLAEPITFSDASERSAAINFFNAAFRAEESGLRQAHELADEVGRWDPELARVLELYGNEEGWHRELLESFLSSIGGEVRPMGRVTRSFYAVYARAKRMETIVLTNLMFETIGATTYRLALGRVEHPAARQMLTILTRDESFHVPLNVHFLSRILERRPKSSRWRLKLVYQLLFVSLLGLPFASRPKAQAFDKITRRELGRAYAEQLARLFTHEPSLGLKPPRALLALLGLRDEDLREPPLAATGAEAAEAAAVREQVEVRAL
ncbi:MAG TPA: ferritin-like domain-containing protein [Polyangiaceae bacterium]